MATAPKSLFLALCLFGLGCDTHKAIGSSGSSTGGDGSTSTTSSTTGSTSSSGVSSERWCRSFELE